MATEFDSTRLVIQVTDGRYECYGTPTRKNKFLAEYIKRMGGIANTVPDGKYHGYFKRTWLVINVILEPIK